MFWFSSMSQVLTMRNLLFSWICSIFFGIHIAMVSGECLSDQKVCLEDEMSFLVQLKSTLKFNAAVSNKLVSWDQTTDCCSWGGVTWDASGHVVGLDLSRQSISGGFNSSCSIFDLQHLQSLNLAYNSFFASQIPTGLGKLGNLTYLNLSNAGFSGQIPIEISRLTRLVTIDFSILHFPGIPTLRLENPNLRMLVENLRELRELHLNGVNISAQGKEWCQALSSSLPNLRVLGLSHCHLSGPMHFSLEKLRFLTKIRLDNNNFSTPVPQFLGNFSNLTQLCLGSCGLCGNFPKEIIQVPTLQSLDLSDNELLHGSLPEFPENGSIETLMLTDTTFSGEVPDSIGNLKRLTRIELARCNFSGAIPKSIANLTKLVYLDFSENWFSGGIPSFSLSQNMTQINLSLNNLEGPIPFNWEQFVNLTILDLSYNSLGGSLPASLFSLSSLQKLQLSNNRISGQLIFFRNAASSMLSILDLSCNNLEGPIPVSVFELRGLSILDLSSNKFNGTVKLSEFEKLGNLTTLSLSYNNLRIIESGNDSVPDFRSQSRLKYLDLSDNQIQGRIPSWIWKIGNGSLMHLNLSHNSLEDLEQPSANLSTSLYILDLHSNRLRGRIPTPPLFSGYVDYSNNSFNSSIPEDIGKFISYTIFFSLSKNNITGVIPASICNASYLQVLDFSNNDLTGEIPSCLIENEVLLVLNLRRNSFRGNIPGNFPGNCGLQTLDLNRNVLHGKIPESLANCKELEVLNLGNNQMNDTFPCMLKNITSLRVLVLKANNFHGHIGCPKSNSTWAMLQIVDLAYNSFSGKLPDKSFLTWTAMMANEDEVQSKLKHQWFEVLKLRRVYYQDVVTVTSKGQEMECGRVLMTAFTAINFAQNNFEGRIPEVIGNFISLYVLNMSGNGLTGQIPSTIGQLRQLESLDLSRNHLGGVIPSGLVNLNFLSVLNLSFNQLEGTIPTGTQIQTFSATAFEGNKGLCGPPLNVSCEEAMPPTSEEDGNSGSRVEIKWDYIALEIGFVTGLAFVILPLMLFKRWRKRYYKHVNRILSRILHSQYQARASHRRRAYRSGRRQNLVLVRRGIARVYY